MTVNPHTMRAIGREKTADLLRAAAGHRTAAAASRTAAPADATRPASEPATRPQPSASGRHDLIPAGTEQR